MRQLLENIEEFITLIQNRPPLYNFNLDEYNDKDLTRKLWEEIANEFNTNVDYCKTKWGILRVSFARQMRNEKTNSKSTNETLINDWYLKNNMSFMRDFMRKRKSPKSIENFNENCTNDTNASLPESKSAEIKRETISSNPSTLQIKNEPMLLNDNESLASLDICSNEDFVENNMRLSNDSSFVSNDEKHSITTSLETESFENTLSRPNNHRKRTKSNEDGQCSMIKKRIATDLEADPALKSMLSQANNSWLPRAINAKLNQRNPPSNMEQVEDPAITFFKSILPDYKKLTGRRQRMLKQKLLENLNKLLDEQEIDP